MASAYWHQMGTPTEEMKRDDIKKFKDRFRKFLNDYREEILADSKEGIPLPITVPHPLDSHLHHRISTEIYQTAIRELREEPEIKRLLQNVLEISYLAPWAGGYNVYSYGNRAQEALANDVAEIESLTPERKKRLELEAEAAKLLEPQKVPG